MLELLDTDPVRRALLEDAVGHALRHLDKSFRQRAQVAVMTPGEPRWEERLTTDAALVVMTLRPTPTQATVALMLGASAYLPLDVPAARTADALRRVDRGRLHIEPEAAAGLLVLLDFVEVRQETASLRLALRMARRGWSWPLAATEAGLSPGRAAELISGQLRGPRHARLR